MGSRRLAVDRAAVSRAAETAAGRKEVGLSLPIEAVSSQRKEVVG
jgi:hypothetical protein